MRACEVGEELILNLIGILILINHNVLIMPTCLITQILVRGENLTSEIEQIIKIKHIFATQKLLILDIHAMQGFRFWCVGIGGGRFWTKRGVFATADIAQNPLWREIGSELFDNAFAIIRI